jgi:hypothetical protein
MLNKRWFPVLIIALLIGSSLSLKSIYAQKYYEQESIDIYEELDLIEKKVDKALRLLEGKDNKEILKKLDQILENQAQIKDELRIIKVRASR